MRPLDSSTPDVSSPRPPAYARFKPPTQLHSAVPGGAKAGTPGHVASGTGFLGGNETGIDLYQFLDLRISSRDDEYELKEGEEMWSAIGSAGPEPIAADHQTTTCWEVLGASQDRSLETPRAIPGVRVYFVRHPGEDSQYILKHPTRQQLMQLSPDAYFLWQRFDGEKTVRDLIFDYLQRYGAVATEKVLDVIDQANERGFLLPPGTDVYKQLTREVAAAHVRWAFKLREFFNRKWSIPGFEKFLAGVAKFGGWMAFNRWVLIFIFTPLIVYGMHRWIQELGVQKYELLKTYDSFLLGILTYVAIKVFIGIVHEFSQAVYLKSLGREVPEAGVIWYYGLPFTFHNSNDIWLEPKKRRLLHSGIGLGAELVIGSLAYVVLQILAINGVPETSLAANIAYKVGMLAFFGAFFKLNPLIELDGYFLLVDIVQIPRLMRRSFYFLEFEIWGKLYRRESFSRREQIYILFGLIAILWMIVFYTLLVIIGKKHVAPMWTELTSGGVLALMLYGAVICFLLFPAIASAWSYLWVMKDQIRDVVVKFLVYTSQKLVMLSLIGAAVATPFILQLTPILELDFNGNALGDGIYLPLMRWLTALACAIASAMLFLPYFRQRWIDAATQMFLRHLAISAACFAIAQSVYIWTITFAKKSYEATTLIAASFEVVAALVLIPGVYVLYGRIKKFPKLRKPFLIFISIHELATLGVALVIFFVLGELYFRHYLAEVAAGYTAVIDTAYIWLAAVRAVGLAAYIFILIPLWLWVASTVWSRSFFPWLGIGVSISIFALSIVFHAFDEALHFAIGLTRQHYAMNACAGLTLLFSVCMLLVFRYQLRFKVQGAEDLPVMGERELLREVLSKLCWSLVKNVEENFGRARRDALRLAFERRAGDGVTLAVGELTDAKAKDLSLPRLGRRSRAIFQRVTNVFIEEFGWTLYRRALVNIHDGLFWEERELAHRHIFRDTNWGVTLAHYEAADLTPDARREIFRRIPLFSEFNDDELVALMSRFREETFTTGSIVFRHGDESDKLYIVLAGRVVVEPSYDTDAPNQPPLAELRRGDYFGEVSLIKEATRTATVRCVEPTTMLSLDKHTYQELAEGYRVMGRKIEEAFEFLDLLEEMPVFRELSPQRIREVATCMRQRNLDAGEIVLRQGHVSHAFCVVRHGILKSVTNFGAPDEWLEGELGRGRYFGEVSLLEDIPSPVTIVAITEVELLELDRADFERLLGKYVALASPGARTLTRKATTEAKKRTSMHGKDTRMSRFRMVDRTTRRTMGGNGGITTASGRLIPVSNEDSIPTRSTIRPSTRHRSP